MGANQSIRAGHIRAASSSSLHPPVSGARGRAARARSGSYANMRCQLIRFSPFLPILVSPSRSDTHFLCSLSLSLALSVYVHIRCLGSINLNSSPFLSPTRTAAAPPPPRESQPPHVPMSAFSDKEQPERARKRPRETERVGRQHLVKIENEQEEREKRRRRMQRRRSLALSKRKRKGDKARGPGCRAPVCLRVRLLVRISRNLQPRLVCRRLLARMAEARADGRVTALRRPSREIVYTHYNRRPSSLLPLLR